jgi:predicted metal-dependent hydrolase
MNKKILVAAFINRNESDSFIKYIEKEFEVEISKIFKFTIQDNSEQYLFTFYLETPIDEKINLRKYFKNALIVHKKKKTFYTINALNKLIEKEFNLKGGNIDYKKYKINWSKFKNKLILTNNNLLIISIKRVFS